MTTWCARSTASISPPRPSSATMEACGPRAPASLRSSLSPSIFPFFNSFMLFFFLIRLDLVVLVIWFSFFFFSEIIFWFFLLIYVVDWSFWLCLFPRKKNSRKMFYTLIRLISDCFLEDLYISVLPQSILMKLTWFDLQSITSCIDFGFGFGFFSVKFDWAPFGCREKR